MTSTEIEQQPKNKNSVRTAVIAIALIALAAIIITCLIVYGKVYAYAIHTNNMQEAQAAVNRYYGSVKIKVLDMTNEGAYVFMLLQDTNTGKVGLSISQSSQVFDNRFRLGEPSFNSSQTGTFNFRGKYEGALCHHAAMIVVYGVNTDMQASYYTFENSGRLFTQRIAGQDYFVHAYLLDAAVTPSSYGYYYDSNGEIIKNLNSP